ncbi:MAG TPA: AraC family transcriptional regulator, partial [Rhodopila sp.]|uniref:AraC family transcriptional regulator n=1 Tax=Rhodopila sp. TaxID=2480087 RepID=UPI002CC375D0
TFEDVVRGLRHARSIDFRSVRLPPFGSLLPLFPRIDALLAVRDALFAEDLALAVAAEAVRVDHETDDAPSDARDEARVGKALEAIGTNYRDPLTIAGLAAISGLSVRRFASVFRQVTSETPYRYVLSLRLLAAADRLCRTEEPVLQVALDCGFGDLSEFTRRFHARFGLPPNRYRRLYRR